MADKQSIRRFVERWQQAEGNEEREARSFLIEFLQDALGIQNPTRVLDFERRVKGRMIDAFYEDMGILIEAKSRKPGILDEPRDNGKYGYETPYQQAKWYANELPASIKPRWIIVTDFDEFRIHDLDLDNPEKDYVSVKIEDLADQVYLFDFFFDKSQSRLVKEKKLSIEAGEIVGRLYDAFYGEYKSIDGDDEQAKREQRSLNVLIVRLVFLLYAEDSGLLQEHQAFYKYMKKFDAQQSRQALIHLFQILDTPEDKRDPYVREDLLAFPWVNGELFKDEDIIIPQFTEDLRQELLVNASLGFDWKDISPTIFGAVFESTLNPDTRRAGGMHYTSIENIHKVIDPLFLDDLKDELADIEGEKVEKRRIVRLRAFQSKLASITIFDPACGSGNFLTESYIQLRKLENRVLENIQGSGQLGLGFEGDVNPVHVSIKQFYGIEINDFAVSVAKTALWIAESQMLDETQDLLLTPLDFFPLTTNATIVEGNALRMDWNDVLPASVCTYLLGNPPFKGAHAAEMPRTAEQTEDLKAAFENKRGIGEADYVAGWFAMAVKYMQGNPTVAAFVSTNSIAQGQQPGLIWPFLEQFGAVRVFAYESFLWNTETAGRASVAVTIVGFTCQYKKVKQRLFETEYRTGIVTGERIVQNLNAYLLDLPDFYLQDRSAPMCDVPEMRIGNKPIDGGNFIFSKEEMDAFITAEPASKAFFHLFLGSREFLNGKERFILWVGDLSEDEIKAMPLCQERVDAVREYRLSSSSAGTRAIASKPTRFHVENIPNSSFMVVPEVSSETRVYIPVGFLDPSVLCSNKLKLVTNATLYHYGIIQSLMHNAWMRVTGGRMKRDYSYSSGIVYNNFIWPDPTPEQRDAIERAAQAVLDARDAHPGWSLADLYDPDKMPADLLAAHKTLDAAVEAAYDVDFQGDEEKIVAHLFKLYAEATKE